MATIYQWPTGAVIDRDSKLTENKRTIREKLGKLNDLEKTIVDIGRLLGGKHGESK